MAKVFILGCNNNQIPYLRAVQKLGFKVIGTDMNPNAPGSELADRFYNVSYTDIDGLKHVAEIEGWDSEDRIFTAAAHFAYEGASNLAAALGISFIRPDSVDTCLDKTKFYALLKKYNVPVPPTSLYNVVSPIELDIKKVYFLKSDYGKSPNYCYRIVNGQIPSLPKKHDPFYRQHFLIQEEVRGTHYRVNLYAGQASVFMKFSDTASVPIQVLGPGHAGVVNSLRKVVSALGFENMLTKFDLIVNEENWYVIDIGLDPPMRFKLLCEYLGIDFPSAYTRYYLLGDVSEMPVGSDICNPVVIQGSPQQGFEFIKIGGVG
jgi:hypothetical protein